ncbi:MAG: TSUP family transporter [Candidatus Competibacteraceae bacterium]
MITGLLSGLFGVGGGFLIVPALVLVLSMPIHKAAATSLLVIAIISVAGVIAHLLTGQTWIGNCWLDSSVEGCWGWV